MCNRHGECVKDSGEWVCRCHDNWSGPGCSLPSERNCGDKIDNDGGTIIVLASIPEKLFQRNFVLSESQRRNDDNDDRLQTVSWIARIPSAAHRLSAAIIHCAFNHRILVTSS